MTDDIRATEVQSRDQWDGALKKFGMKTNQLSAGGGDESSALYMEDGALIGRRSSPLLRTIDAINPQGRLLLLAPSLESKLVVNGRVIGSNDVFISSDASEVRMICEPHGANYCVSISEQWLQQNGLTSSAVLLELAHGRAMGSCSSEVKGHFLKQIQSTLQMLSSDAGRNPGFRREQFADLMAASREMLLAMSGYRPDGATVKLSTRARVVDRALEYIVAVPPSEITVPDVAAAAHASVRTLEYSFKDVLGLTPKRFIVRHKMNCIRRELLASAPESKVLRSIMQFYNITNPARFANDYKEIFGESPADTLMAKRPVMITSTELADTTV